MRYGAEKVDIRVTLAPFKEGRDQKTAKMLISVVA